MSSPVDRLPGPPPGTGSGIAPVGAPTGAPAAPASPLESTASFRALLEKLERLAAQPAPDGAVDDAESLKAAVARADDGFQQVMDLRRKLEEAWKQRST